MRFSLKERLLLYLKLVVEDHLGLPAKVFYRIFRRRKRSTKRPAVLIATRVVRKRKNARKKRRLFLMRRRFKRYALRSKAKKFIYSRPKPVALLPTPDQICRLESYQVQPPLAPNLTKEDSFFRHILLRWLESWTGSAVTFILDRNPLKACSLSSLVTLTLVNFRITQYIPNSTYFGLGVWHGGPTAVFLAIKLRDPSLLVS